MGRRSVKSKDIMAALRACRGIVTDAAEMVGCTRMTVYNRINAEKQVREVFEECWEINIDTAESQLLKKLDDGEMSAINKVLNEKGRSRGWGNTDTHRHEGEVVIRHEWLTPEDDDV